MNIRALYDYWHALTGFFTRSLARKLCVWLLIEMGAISLLGYVMFICMEIKQIEKGVGNSYTQMSRIIADGLEKYIRREVDESDNVRDATIIIDAVKESNKRLASRSSTELLQEAGRLDLEWERTIGMNGILEQILESPASLYLKEIQGKKSAMWKEICVTDERGWLVAASGKTTDFYQADELWWQKAYRYGKGSDYFSNLEYDASSRSWGFVIARPVFDNGKVIGVLKCILDQAYINKYIETVVPARQGQITVIDSAGKILFDSFLLPGTLDKTYKHEIVCDINAYKRDGYVIGLNMLDNTSIVGFSLATLGCGESDALQWYVLYAQTLDSALDPFMIRFPLIIAMFIVSVCLLLGGNILIARRITRPIRILHSAVEGIIRGDFHTRVAIKTSDEIGKFADVINDMVHIIKNREVQLTQRAVEITALGEVCRMVALDKNFDQVVERILGVLVENKNLRMDAVAASLYIHQATEGKFYKRAHAGFLRAASELELSAIPEEHLSHLMDRKQSLVMPELRQHDTVMHMLSLLYETKGLSSLYIYPIVSRSGVLGILLIASVNPLVITGDENKILRIICDQISQGLENEKLFKDMFERHWEMYWLHEAAVIVSSQHDFGLLISAMAKIMMASCKAEKIIYVPSERVQRDLGIAPPGEAYGFYGDSGIIVEHDVINLLYAYAGKVVSSKQYAAIEFDAPALKDAVCWKQFRNHVSSGIVVPIRLPEDAVTIGSFFIFSDRPGAFTKERLIKLLLTYVKYISDAYPTLLILRKQDATGEK